MNCHDCGEFNNNCHPEYFFNFNSRSIIYGRSIFLAYVKVWNTINVNTLLYSLKQNRSFTFIRQLKEILRQIDTIDPIFR